MDGRALLPGFLHVLGAAAVVYLLFTLFVYLIQEQLIFFPKPVTRKQWEETARAANGETMTVSTGSGAVLRGWFLPGDGAPPRPTVLLFGGNAMQLDRFTGDLRPLRREGINVLLIDYRGYGASGGTPSAQAIEHDALRIYDAAAARDEVDADRIIPWGISIGTAAATTIASERPVAGVVLFAPFTSTLDVAQELYPFLPVRLLLRHRLSNLAAASATHAPALIVAGTADRVGGPEHARTVAEHWGGPHDLVLLEGRGHNELLAGEEVWERVVEFVENH